MAPQMIMAWGMARLIERFGTGASGFLIEGPTLDVGAVIGRLLAASEAATPVTLIGASFGFVHVLDELARRGERISLPPSSRVMDAGGFKGRSREVAPEALRAMMVEWLGVRETHCVNLLGMTELASQLYDDRLRAHVAGRAAKRGKVGPPWCATVALDPETLARCEDEVPGMLAHLDLANVERPAVVRTTDIGVTHGDGSFSIWGRAQSDDAAGCSLAIEEFAARASGA